MLVFKRQCFPCEETTYIITFGFKQGAIGSKADIRVKIALFQLNKSLCFAV